MLFQGFVAAVTILWLMSYFNFRRIFGYAAVVDIAITGMFMWMFAGSFGGMMTGLIAGLIVSITLKFGGRIFGKERAMIARKKGHLLPSIIWTRVEG